MRLVNAYLDEKTGKSYATVEHNIGGVKRRFEGMAKAHPEEEHTSRFTGCRYAEMRAQIKALKAERAYMISKCEECRNFVKACSQYKGWDKNSTTAKAIYRQLNKRIKAVNELTNRINQLMWDLKIGIRQQNSIQSTIEKSRGQRARLSFIDEVAKID